MAKAKSGSRSTAKAGDNWTADQCVDVEFAKGPHRAYLLLTPPAEASVKRSLHRSEYLLIGVLMLIAFYVRMYGLTYPNLVVFDEVHFGGFAAKYIRGEYFMDVHPPLAKMLFAGVGAIGGFKGNFNFKLIGDLYPSYVPYVLMRQFPAVLGILVCLLCYVTLRQAGVRPVIAFFTTFLLIIENAQVTISRYILLDSPLIFFIAATAYGYKKFEIASPYTANWYKLLFATAVGLGLALLAKWVGLFTVAWVGVLCAVQMWFLVGDLTVKPASIVRHAVWRATVLLGVPLALYYVFFAVHFSVLHNDSDGAALMLPMFRAGLDNNRLPKTVLPEVGYGLVISIRHVNTAGGYLHSHPHPYKTGSKQQQITLYPHIDINNEWLIEPYNASFWDNTTFVPLTNGIKVRLKHVQTHRRLHSHDHKPPVLERDWQKEVSCYGFENFTGDANDDWVVEIVDYKLRTDAGKKLVRAMELVIRFRHAMTGNYLFSLPVKLPEWGFGQQEVSAAGLGSRPLTHWMVETNTNPFNNLTEQQPYPTMLLWQKFAHSHKRMWLINANLKDHHPWQSDAIDWPMMPRGINYWVHDKRQVYLLGNAPIWWVTTATIVAAVIYAGITGLRWLFGADIAVNKHVFNYNYQMFSFVLGWALHYFPFFIMGRQLFLHHYLPAYYFGILALGQTLEVVYAYVTANKPIVRKAFVALLAVLAVVSLMFYWQYLHFTYGLPQLKSLCQAKKLWNWDFDCNAMPESWEALAKWELEEKNKPKESDKEKIAPPNQGEFDAKAAAIHAKLKEDKAAEVEDVSPKNDAVNDVKEPQAEEQLVPEFEEQETDEAEDAPVEEVEAVEVDVEEEPVDEKQAQPAEGP